MPLVFILTQLRDQERRCKLGRRGWVDGIDSTVPVQAGCQFCCRGSLSRHWPAWSVDLKHLVYSQTSWLVRTDRRILTVLFFCLCWNTLSKARRLVEEPISQGRQEDKSFAMPRWKAQHSGIQDLIWGLRTWLQCKRLIQDDNRKRLAEPPPCTSLILAP